MGSGRLALLRARHLNDYAQVPATRGELEAARLACAEAEPLPHTAT
jgi:hypothetical protein